MENNDNMAQPSNLQEFKPIIPKREQEYIKMTNNIKEKLKKSLFNNTKNWPVYTDYLPKSDPRYTGL